MNTTILARDGARVMGISAVVLVATLAALLAIFALAKPSEAEDPILTIRPSSADFGNVTVGASSDPVVITVENNGGTDLVLGGAKILGVDTGSFIVSGLDSNGLLSVKAGETANFTVTYEPVKTGLETVQLTFDTVKNAVTGVVTDVEAPTVNLTGQGVSTNPAGSGCTITGSNDSETLRGTRGRDVICALGGNDKVRPLSGKDVTRAGSGEDRVTDKRGKRDKLLGQSGADTLNARDGNRDVLKGGGGKDTCRKNKSDTARSC